MALSIHVCLYMLATTEKGNWRYESVLVERGWLIFFPTKVIGLALTDLDSFLMVCRLFTTEGGFVNGIGFNLFL